jgi:hypothetical protein
MRQFPPARIVCLTEETVETLYLLADCAAQTQHPPTSARDERRLAHEEICAASLSRLGSRMRTAPRWQ